MAMLDKILGAVAKAIAWLTCLLVSLMVLNTALGVFCRFVLNNSLSWTDELGRYMMIWVGFFGCYFAARDGSHVGIEMFVNRFGPGARRAFAVVSRLVVIAFLTVVLAKSEEQLGLLAIQRSSALELPMALPYSAVTVGIFLMLIENLAHLARLLLAPEPPAAAACKAD